MDDRGAAIDAMLERIREVWDDERSAPTVGAAPTLLVGGGVDASFARAAQFGDGWIAGGSPPDALRRGGREGQGRVVGGRPRGRAAARRPRLLLARRRTPRRTPRPTSTDYYAWLGEETADYIADWPPRTRRPCSSYLAAFEGVGCDELILFPSSTDPDQVDLLADAAGL